ncbi:hypothetical protein Tco_0703336 [Tanacetum coccineum]|uniref:Uncharacterized protein n=1 Tax=Tanacetum coccineum TaxID=301880 RepID=A0ABQ4Y0B4_9ASTR
MFWVPMESVKGLGETKEAMEPNLSVLSLHKLMFPLVNRENLNKGWLRYDLNGVNVRKGESVPTEMELVLEYTQQGASHEVSDHLKMEMEMEIPSSSNVKLITECSDTTYTCYEVMKDLIKVSKLPQLDIHISS